MAETLVFSNGADRETRYRELNPHIVALTDGESDNTANLANVAAALKETFGFFWVGFYLSNGSELVVGPFQGPVACTRIPFGKGVCGHAFSTEETVIVPDVEQFPGHIACSSDSRSEIVIPIFAKDKEVLGVLDVDSNAIDDFSHVDRNGLEAVVRVVEEFLNG